MLAWQNNNIHLLAAVSFKSNYFQLISSDINKSFELAGASIQ